MASLVSIVNSPKGKQNFPISGELLPGVRMAESDPCRRDTGFASHESPPSDLTLRTPAARTSTSADNYACTTPDDLLRGYDDLHRELTDFLDTIRRREPSGLRDTNLSENRQDFQISASPPFSASSTRQFGSNEEALLTNSSRANDEVGGVTTASGSAAADSGLPLPRSSAVLGSQAHDVNNDVVNESNVTTARVKVRRQLN